MMIKVFTTEKDGKIALSAKELKELLDEAYWEGYRNNNHTWTYTTPTWFPYYYSTTKDGITINTSDEAKRNSITTDHTTVSNDTTIGIKDIQNSIKNTFNISEDKYV